MLKAKYLHDQDVDYAQGFHAFALNLGIKKEKPDVAILLCKEGAVAGGVFTKNLFRSSSLDHSQKKLKNKIRALTVFSGNANACTGPHGEQTNKILAKTIAKTLGCKDEEILLSYTGVVGREFPHEKVSDKLVEALQLETGKPGSSARRMEWDTVEFAKGILTTDTREKRIACEVAITGNKKFRMAACAKGAGMIHPNMGTLLAFITTDLVMKGSDCQKLLDHAVTGSFNQCTVDGDTSTNDSCFMMASGRSGIKVGEGVSLEQVQELVDTLCTHLAREVARDGEGATKFITVQVEGAASLEHARKAAKAVASSLLFKTAVFGADPNYGRILVALGNAGLPLKQEHVEVNFGKIPLFKLNKVQTANISKAAAYLKENKEIDINISLGMGKFQSQAWTCDITYDYVKINAEYTT
ncbi:MAG: bifunctional glutamate N-acetyltransferase/amino-acid acetyltransferase ArgJ [Spirochaetes bacterium]|nr:bifunctional glutamate N-acetyltransferase/amino-acid acetyltransferase ArgJ [Spirochaetota bacterium]